MQSWWFFDWPSSSSIFAVTSAAFFLNCSNVTVSRLRFCWPALFMAVFTYFTASLMRAVKPKNAFHREQFSNDDLKRIQCSFIRVVVKSKTKDEELTIEMRAFHLLRPVLFLHCQDKGSFMSSQPPPSPIPFYNLPFALPMSPSGASRTPSYYFWH